MIDVDAELDTKEIDYILQGMAKRLKKIKDGEKEYSQLIGANIVSDVFEHFEKEQGPDGKWKKWSTSYNDFMKKIGRQNNKILQFSGKLKNNLKPTKVKKTGAGLVWYNDAKTKTGYQYAAGHNLGDGKLPQREFMYLSNDAINKIAQQTLIWMIEKGI